MIMSPRFRLANPIAALLMTLAFALMLPARADPGWSANLNLVSHYRFRGIDQTWGRPALQGGLDWSTASGWYAGAWASNVQERSYPGGHAELDLYGGYNGKIGTDWSYTAGLYGYIYPGANLQHAHCSSAAFGAPCGNLSSQRYDTLEVNGGVTWKWLAYKLSVSATDYFGANTRTGYNRSTRGTLYHDLTATVPLDGTLSLILHAGYTDMRARYGAVNPSYADWRVAVAKTIEGGWSASVNVVGATNNDMYRPPGGGLSATDGATRALNRTALVVQVGRTF